MSSVFSQITVGPRRNHKRLSVFPLFADLPQVNYLLATPAMGAGQVKVLEMRSQQVPFLEVSNAGPLPVLFLEGEILVGGGQNRVVNTSVLVAKGTARIPVSCVEQRRWQHGTGGFSASDSHVPTSTRGSLKRSTTKSVSDGEGHHSDQGTVWASVESTVCFSQADAPTRSVTKAYESVADRLGQYDAPLSYVESATGLAVADGERVLCVELFDRPDTAKLVWQRIVRAAAIDALRTEDQPGRLAEPSDIRNLLASALAANWTKVPAAGEGEEHRASFSNDEGSVLSLDGSLVHGSLVLAH